jgi:hypothetical protein
VVRALTTAQLARRIRRRARVEEEQRLFLRLCELHGLPLPRPEYKFNAPHRKWALDWAWPEWKVALEQEGVVWTGGKSRHTTGSGFRGDLHKYNTAAYLGWVVYRFLPEQVRSAKWVEWIRDTIERRKSKTL